MVKRVLRSENLGSFFSLQNHNLFCVKFAASFFLVGIAFRLLFWDSFSFSSFVVIQIPSPPPQTETKVESSVVSSPLKAPEYDEFQVNNKNQTSLNGKKLFFSVVFVNILFICDIYVLHKCYLKFSNMVMDKIKIHTFLLFWII